ncbi:MAG TPA: replication factor C small subunit [Thermoproteota archaeon]|nr:replication factor C small subunit [Thermoproteota archaeon]
MGFVSIRDLVWAEKYRPKTLEEMLNREEIVTKLKTFASTKNMPHLLFVGPPGTSKTTAALALVNDIYDGNASGNYIELNASDERGIEVVRIRIKEFAKSIPMAEVPFRVIILDESDNMTSDAQQALRRTLEKYSDNTRFILIANELYKIIEPIQSRCSVFRFGPLRDEIILKRLKYIAEKEGVRCDEEALTMIVERADGDMRMAINLTQGIAASQKKVDAKAAREFLGSYGVDKVDELIDLGIAGDFSAALDLLGKIIHESGVQPKDVVRKLHRRISSMDIMPESKMSLLSLLAETEYRIMVGADPEIQFTLVLAKLAQLKGSR